MSIYLSKNLFPVQMKEIKTLDPLKVAPEHRNQIAIAQLVRL